MIHRALLSLAAQVILGALAYADASRQAFQFQEPGMGTVFTIQVYAESLEQVRPTIDQAWERLEELNAIFSDYDPNSELMQFCRRPAGSRVPLSPELHEVLSLSQSLAAMTDGAFDVTIGPLKRLWKHTRRDARLPRPEKLERAFQLSGWEKLKLHPDGSGSLLVNGMSLDLGGIAKGYAARDLVKQIETAGFPSVLVAASGDIAVADPPPGRSAWMVGVVTSERQIELPPHSAISTSGDSQQHVEIAGQRYSHILNPKTGLGLTQSTTVTVMGPDAVWTDALATAVSILGGPEALPERIRSRYTFLQQPGP